MFIQVWCLKRPELSVLFLGTRVKSKYKPMGAGKLGSLQEQQVFLITEHSLQLHIFIFCFESGQL